MKIKVRFLDLWYDIKIPDYPQYFGILPYIMFVKSNYASCLYIGFLNLNIK